MSEVKQMMVKGSSPVRELAGSVVKCYESGERTIELRAIGAGSVNQMYKALATARPHFQTYSYLTPFPAPVGHCALLPVLFLSASALPQPVPGLL